MYSAFTAKVSTSLDLIDHPLTFPAFVVTALVSLAIALFCIALLPIWDILRIVRAGRLRWGWIGLTTLLILGILCCGVFAWLRDGDVTTELDNLIVALIIFIGACFTVGISFLSRQTAKDLQRIATLERDAFVDPLTGLYNRRYLMSRLDGEIARAHRYERGLSALMIDVDHFKRINDGHGHTTGDNVLRSICAIITRESRPSDIVTRYGGEEILLIAPDTKVDAAFALAQRLRRAIIGANFLSAEGTSIPVSASFGLASLLAVDDAGALIARADRALYEAKNGGRNRVCGPEP